MVPSIVEELEQAGIEPGLAETVPYVPVRLSKGGTVATIGDDVPVTMRDIATSVRLPPISALFAGHCPAPDVSREPPAEYYAFFATIERTAMEFCRTLDRVVPDREFERLYRHLLRQPDGRDENPQFSYLQAALRLYMSIADVSRAELDAVLFRLVRSVKRFSEGRASANYCRIVGDQVAQLS